MELEKNEMNLKKSVPSELRAVITIFSADSELKAKALTHVDIEAREVNWYAIAKNHFGSGHGTAILWAKSIWTARQPTQLDIFERSTSMDLNVRRSVLCALLIAWGLD